MHTGADWLIQPCPEVRLKPLRTPNDLSFLLRQTPFSKLHRLSAEIKTDDMTAPQT